MYASRTAHRSLASKPDKDHLLALILQPEPPAEPVAPVAAQWEAQTEVHSHFADWLRELERHLPPPGDAELDEYYRYALMGLVVGFGDRNLSPYVAEHAAIIAPLLADIRAVYERIKTSGSTYSPEEFIFRAYDYGINKAYWLDWDLYLSKDMY